MIEPVTFSAHDSASLMLRKVRAKAIELALRQDLDVWADADKATQRELRTRKRLIDLAAEMADLARVIRQKERQREKSAVDYGQELSDLAKQDDET